METAFSNPNGYVNEKALDWICAAVKSESGYYSINDSNNNDHVENGIDIINNDNVLGSNNSDNNDDVIISNNDNNYIEGHNTDDCVSKNDDIMSNNSSSANNGNNNNIYDIDISFVFLTKDTYTPNPTLPLTFNLTIRIRPYSLQKIHTHLTQPYL
jgi:hypothetical protein